MLFERVHECDLSQVQMLHNNVPCLASGSVFKATAPVNIDNHKRDVRTLSIVIDRNNHLSNPP